MGYDEMKRSHLILSILAIIPAIFIFIGLGVSTQTVKEAFAEIAGPSVIDNADRYILGIIFITLAMLYKEGTFHWLWRVVIPSSAPIELSYQQSPKTGYMPAALMGTSTRYFSVEGLDINTIALVKFSLNTLKKRDRRTLIGIESYLRLGDGRRYNAFQKIVADGRDCKDLGGITHAYLREINGNPRAATQMFCQLCELAVQTKNTDRATTDRLVKLGQQLRLSPQDMANAIARMRS